MQTILETPRLYLRQFNLEDAPLILCLNGSFEVVRYVHEPVLENQDQAEAILREKILPQYDLGFGRWAIHLREDHRFIGWCGLKKMEKPDLIDLGFRLVPEAWGLGYATEAARATVDYGLRQLHLPLITALVLSENRASRNILEKIGMKRAGTTQESGATVLVYTISPAD